MKYEKNTLYINGGRNTEVTAPDVTLGDILSMECTDKLMLAKIRSRKILRFPKKKKGRRVISVLEIISCIHEEFPDLDVRNLGETDMLITYEQLEVSRQTAGELAALRAEAKADSVAAGRLARWSLVVALLTLLVSIGALVVAICAANG